MKKTVLIILILAVIFSFSAFCKEESVTVRVNGNLIESDVPPLLKDGRTFLPLRAILNAIGVDNENITWWELSRSVEIRHKDIHIFMILDSTQAIVNDSIYNLDAPAFETGGRTLVPVRFLSENLNCRVLWDDETYTVDIITAQIQKKGKYC